MKVVLGTYMNINTFTLDHKANELLIEFSDDIISSLSFEFLRVYSPLEKSKTKGVVAHQKMVVLKAIEPVGKHGFRFVFDDGHSAIYPIELLKDFTLNKETLWKTYLKSLQESGQNREAMIAFKQV